MAGYPSEEKWKQPPQESFPYYTQERNEEEEEEEALSLCDLPVSLIKKDDTQTLAKEEQEEEQSLLKETANQEEFEFGRWGGDPLSIRSEMCAAEDIFYKGQILPLRHSFSLPSDKCLIQDRLRHNVLNPVANCSKDEFWVSTISLNSKKSVSRSESMDRALLSGFNSSRSSSSSSRSTQYSSSTSITVTATTNSDFVIKRIFNDKKNSKPRIPSQFRGNHPSPGPQLRHSNVILGSGFIRNRKSSSIWDFFKLGLVRTPGNGIHELQDLKVRTTVSRNSSSGSSNNSIGNSNSNTAGRSKKNNNISGASEEGNKVKKQGLFEKRGGGSLISGCSCTINAVKPIPLSYVLIKSNNNCNNNVEAKKKKRKKKKKKSMEKLTKQNEVGKVEEDGLGKQETSRHRTFEWVKELSHASYLDQQEKEAVATWDS